MLSTVKFSLIEIGSFIYFNENVVRLWPEALGLSISEGEAYSYSIWVHFS